MTLTLQPDEIKLRLKLLETKERSDVRGRHNRQGTAELSVSLPALRAWFWSEVAAGRLPDLADDFRIGGPK